MKWWIPITVLALAAFLFIDHRHKFLLPEALYCGLGLGYGYDFGHSTVCYKCPGDLELYCTSWPPEL